MPSNKIRAGDKSISARAWNKIADAAGRVNGSQDVSARMADLTGRAPYLVYVKNTTGSAIGPYGCLYARDRIFGPAHPSDKQFERMFVGTGIVPVNTFSQYYNASLTPLITLGKVLNGKCCWAVASGITPASVEYVDHAHFHCRPQVESPNPTLVSSNQGYRIVYRDVHMDTAGGLTRLALVDLESPHGLIWHSKLGAPQLLPHGAAVNFFETTITDDYIWESLTASTGRVRVPGRYHAEFSVTLSNTSGTDRSVSLTWSGTLTGSYQPTHQTYWVDLRAGKIVTLSGWWTWEAGIGYTSSTIASNPTISFLFNIAGGIGSDLEATEGQIRIRQV